MAFKVLLIDDEPWALEGLQLWIQWEEYGFEVCATCGNGVEGLKLMDELQPDLVMVDIHMPLMDGLEMIREWRLKGQWQTKFIILTGYGDFEYARKAMKFKVSRYLLKPLDEEQAETEVLAIRQELVKEQEQLHIGQVAQREREMLTIKEALLGKTLSYEASSFLKLLSRSADIWNVCLVQVSEENLARASRMAAEVLDGQDAMYVIGLRNDLLSLVFGDHADEGTREDIRKRMGALARRLAGFRAFMALGVAEYSLDCIRNCYLTAEEALVHAFYDVGKSGMIEYETIKGCTFQRQHTQLGLVERILGAFQLVDHTGYRSVVDDMEQSFWHSRIHPDEARKMVIYVLHEIRSYMGEQLAQDSGGLNRLFEIPNLDEGLLTLDDLIGMLHSCGRVCFELLLKENATEAQGIVQDINDYIEAHFREGLTIKLLAERFFMHPAYLGQLFIRKNGIGFNERLHNLRIEEACRLLQLNQYKNSEISEWVGYSNYNHFLKQFEKRLGMSPNEFKKT